MQNGDKDKQLDPFHVAMCGKPLIKVKQGLCQVDNDEGKEIE